MRKNIFQRLIVGFVAALTLAGMGVALLWYAPVLAQSGSLDLGTSYAAKTGLVSTDIRIVIASVIRAALGFLGTLALIIILYAGFRWMTAAGNDEQVNSAKKILINGVIGLAIILSAFAITNYVITQLNDAINNAGGGGPGPGGGGGPLPPNVLYVSSLPPSGQACVRNVHPTIVFSLNVDIATINGNVVVNNDAGQAVAGSWAYLNGNQTTVSFTPAGSCAPDAGNDCLLPQTHYQLVFANASAVKSADGQLTLNCLIKAGCGPVGFTTGSGVDRLPPTISFVSPAPSDSLQAGTTIPVTVHFTDDNGVQQVSLSSGGVVIGSQSLANCQKTGNVTVAWPTQNLTPGPYTIDATAIDFSAQTGSATTNLTLKPGTCFNGVIDPGETQIDCGGVCGACAGTSCTKNADCASGFCLIPNGNTTGICVNKMSIQGFSPSSGAPSTIVSIDGYYFGATAGHVYFAAVPNPDPTVPANWVEAQLAPCGGPLKSWGNYEILVQVPTGAVNGPIMVVTAPQVVGGVSQTFTDVTNDNAWGPVLNDFQVTNQIRPGLCEAIPGSGYAGDSISLSGKNLGLLDNGQDAVLFADQKAQISAQNWNDSFISTVVPNSAPYGQIAVKVVNNGVESNGIRFSVLSGTNKALPVINTMSPQNGGAGEYITITGSNFGNTQGKVWFKLNGQGSAAIGETNFPVACQNNIWSDTQVLVKVPSSLKGSVGDYTVQVVTGDPVPLASLVSSATHFTLQNVDPAPGICSINPVSGPVPFPVGQTLKITGEYFGPNPAVYFWKTGAATNTIVGRVQADPADSFSVNGNTITARPPATSETGPVIVYRPADTAKSNSLPFTVNDCTKNVPANTCNQAGYTCCISGGQNGMCVPPGQLCQGQTASASYIWRFSTRDIPPVPHVVERCDAQSDLGKNIPSPTPNVQWDATPSGDSHNVCSSALVTVEFSTQIDPATLTASTVVVNSCSSVNGNECTNPVAVPLTAGSLTPLLAQGGAGGNHSFVKLSPQINWSNNTWYQVVLKTGIQSLSPTSSIALAADKPCNDANSAYCFVFRTDQRSCKLNAVLVAPTNYVTKVLESPILYHSNTVDTPVIYNASGISDQHCILMDTKGYNWDWDTANHTYASIYNEVVNATDQKVSALGNTVGINLPNDSVGVDATATTNTPSGLISKTGESPLTIDLSNPEVIKFWPSCLEACTNAAVGAQFNVSMSNRNVLVGNPTSVKLLQCNDENCINTVPVAASLTIGYDAASHNTILNVANVGNVPNLSPNTLYQVILSVSTTDFASPSLLWSAAFSNNYNSFSKPYAKQFTWRFRTKASSCSIDRVAVTPKNFTAQFFNDRQLYQAQPYSSPDQCSTDGQALNAWSVPWSWNTSDAQVAQIQTFTTLGANPYCTATCVRRGSTIAASAPRQSVCGNAVVEAGEDCDAPNRATGCGLDCRYLGNQNPTTCGNGVVEPNLGEACDPKNPGTQIGCSFDCRRTGSVLVPDPNNPGASICGNGSVGSGEDCDTGIVGAIANPQSALYCSAQCLHMGTAVSSLWCFNHAQDRGGFSADEYKNACQKAVSICGDGVTSPDEDAGCDLGGGQYATFCSEKCVFNKDTVSSHKCTPNTEGCDANAQYLGSSLQYSVASSCGDAQVGIGEDAFCESNLNVTHASIIDPVAQAQGVGRGVVSGDPPSQVTNITGGTNQQTKGGTVSGTGTFTLACGYKTDAQCQAVFNSTAYGVGKDTCCYMRPTLTSTFPSSTAPIQKDVCPNTTIEARFNGQIDPSSLGPGSIILATGLNANAPSQAKVLVHTAHYNSPMPGIPAIYPAKTALVGNRLYVTSATVGGELQVYDVSGGTLSFLGKVSDGAGKNLTNAYGITVVGNYAYVTAYSGHGIQIVDISTPSSPTAKGKVFNMSMGSVSDIAVDGNYAFVASWATSNITAINVADVNNPLIVGAIANGQNGALLSGPTSIMVDNGYIYVVSWSGYVQVLRFNSANNTFTVLGGLINGQNIGGKVATISNPAGIAKKGNYLFVASHGFSGVQVIDASNPSALKPTNFIASSATAKMTGPTALTLQGNILYVTSAETPYGMAMFEVTNPLSPVPIASIDRNSDSSGLAAFINTQSVSVSGNYAFVANYAANGGIDVIDTRAFTIADSTCTTDVSNLIVTAIDQPWYKQWWNRMVAIVKNLFGGAVTAKQNFVPTDWCSGAEAGTFEVVNDTTSTSRIIYHLNKPLAFDTTYAVILTSTIKDVRGVNLGTQNNGKLINFQFNTAGALCELSTVSVLPSVLNFSRAFSSTTLEASALTSSGASIQSIPNYYSWQYLWGPQGNQIVSVQNTTSTRAVVTAQNRNGELDIHASAVITQNTISSANGIVATDKSHAIVFLCENPWPTKQATVAQAKVNTFPYSDTANNHSGYALATNAFDGSAIPPSPLPANIVGDGYFNFSTYYCADSGAFGYADDLPLLRPAVQVQNNVVAADNSLKRFIFTTDKNSDAIGIQVFANPKHLSPEDWYGLDKANGGRGFVGALRSLTVNGYKAVRDDNNVYVDAINYATAQQTLYSNIYLISINSDASADTRKVFDQMLANLTFNVNLSNYGYCGATIDTPDFTKACTTDFDCDTGKICSNQIDKLKRNYTRYTDFRTIDNLLATYASAHSGAYPTIQDGSFLTGQALSVWSSAWTALGNTLGTALPLDPINQLGSAGTCASNTGKFCTADGQCGNKPNTATPDTCLLHDPVTGWSVANRRFSFACPVDSYAYRYEFSPSNGFSLRARTEDIGKPVVNYQAFISGFNYSVGAAANSRVTLASANPGICKQSEEISTFAQGVCGDGQINLNLNEQCDPPGSKVYDSSACVANPQGGTVVIRTCGATCQLGSPSTQLCRDFLSPLCGNGKLDAGETCDDGALNGRWNHCTKQCTAATTNPLGYCGDNQPDPKNKLCDPGAVGQVKYGLRQVDSCNFDCQSYGPYCGDGVVSAQYGEECDPKQADLSCSVNNVGGTFVCNSSCKYSDDAMAWYKFDSGPPIIDSSIHQNNAACFGNCPTIAQTVGRVGPSAQFGNAALQVTDAPSLNTTSSITVEAWVAPDAILLQAPGYARIVEKGGWNVGGGYALQLYGTTGKVMFAAFSSDKNTYYTVISKTAIVSGGTNFTHVAATFSRNGNTQTIRVYINGKEDSGEAHVYANGVDTVLPTLSYTGAIRFAADSTGKNLVIGANGDIAAPVNRFRGFMDELRLYNYVLSPNQIESQYNDLSGRVCHVPATVALVAGTCGDGVVQQGTEACDNGPINGQACTPGYNRSCTYCSGLCDNVVTVNAQQYCGNGVIEGPEQCEFDSGGVYAKVYDTNTNISNNGAPVNNASNVTSNGFLAKACSAEPNNFYTFKKGTKVCVNSCSSIQVQETNTQQCVVCGMDAVAGVTVQGGIINVLEEQNAVDYDPTYHNNTPYVVPQNNFAFLRYTGQSTNKFGFVQDENNLSTYTILNRTAAQGGGGNPNNVPSANPMFYSFTDPVQIASNPVCSDTSGAHYQFYSYDNRQTFDFAVKSNPNPWDYDLLFTPAMSASALQTCLKNGNLLNCQNIPQTQTPNNIRIVVRWTKNLDFAAGFSRPIPPNGNGIENVDDTNLTPVYGATDYQTKAPSNVNWASVWFHGLHRTAGTLSAKAFTIDTSAIRAGDSYRFYVVANSPGGIKQLGTSAQLEVDVYFPESVAVPFYVFSSPAKRYFINLADGSEAPNTKYWRVFDILSTVQAGVTNRVIPVVSFDPKTNSMVSYPNGRVVTDPNLAP